MHSSRIWGLVRTLTLKLTLESNHCKLATVPTSGTNQGHIMTESSILLAHERLLHSTYSRVMGIV